MPKAFWAILKLCFASLGATFLVACGPGFHITSVTASVAPGGYLTVIGGPFNVAASISVHLTSGATDVTLQDLQASDSALSGRVPAATPAGLYDAVVTIDEASVTRAAAVTVIAGAMQVYFIDIGQGDSTLIVAPTGEAMLIDGGPLDAGLNIRESVRTLAGDLDAVVLTHTDADHLGGLVDFLAGDDGIAGTVDDVVARSNFAGVDDNGCGSQICADYRALAAYPFDVPQVGERYNLGEVLIEFVAVDGDVGNGTVSSVDDENEKSVVVKASFGGRSVLILGDLTGGGLGEADVETPLAQAIGAVDILRTAHHGSQTSSAATALERFQPLALVVSVGTDNAFCHPAPEALARMDAVGAPIFATGAGMKFEGDRCDEGATAWPAQAEAELGTITLTISADGSMSIDGNAL